MAGSFFFYFYFWQVYGELDIAGVWLANLDHEARSIEMVRREERMGGLVSWGWDFWFCGVLLM